jgi:hypothetical protein
VHTSAASRRVACLGQMADEQVASGSRSMPLQHPLGQTHFAAYNPGMTRTRTAPESALATLPTLSQMIRDGQADTIQHGRRTREALDYWFRQSERLNIARSHYRLRGTRFTDFARRIGVDRASAFRLIKLHKHRGAVLSKCRDELAKANALGETYFYPGWRIALERHEVKALRGRSSAYAWRQGQEPGGTAAASLYEGDNLTLLRSMRGSIQADDGCRSRSSTRFRGCCARAAHASSSLATPPTTTVRSAPKVSGRAAISSG